MGFHTVIVTIYFLIIKMRLFDHVTSAMPSMKNGSN